MIHSFIRTHRKAFRVGTLSALLVALLGLTAMHAHHERQERQDHFRSMMGVHRVHVG